MIDPNVPVAPYRQLAAILRGQIRSGALSGRLPGERYLAQQYELSLGTVRKALDLLRSEDLIETVHGIGSYVTKEPPR